jgi:hypothetical protein
MQIDSHMQIGGCSIEVEGGCLRQSESSWLLGLGRNHCCGRAFPHFGLYPLTK